MIIPAHVDVPQDRYPVVNWLIIAGAIAVFIFQTLSVHERTDQLPAMTKKYENVPVEDMVKEFGVKDKDIKRIEKSVEKPTRIMEDEGLFKKADEREQFKERFVKESILQQYYVLGEIRPYILDGFALKGLFGYMWLHGGILHILGNMLFLWIFGNAICAKIGNLRYIPAYIGLGLVAGISHLVFVGGSMLGASGAINGIVGMFLVLFPQNEITCYWIFFPYIRQFSVSSAWMILFWLVFDILGVILGGGGVAYFAHLGGFAGGVVLASLMLKFKMVTMERYEKSLFQVIEEYRHPSAIENPSSGYYGYLNATANLQQELPLAPIPPVPFEPKTISIDPVEKPQTIPLEPQKPQDEFIRFACACGKRVKMPAKYAGKTGKCPQCNARLKIPEK
ncbi:MAG: rhomboid family intramembrane serine protease [Sedimentisphaerales bacterium]